MIPTAMLDKTILVEPYLGESSLEPVFGPPVKLQARVEHVNPRRIYRTDGEKVLCDAKLFLRPDDDIPELSRVTIDGKTYQVVLPLAMEGLNHTNHIEAWILIIKPTGAKK